MIGALLFLHSAARLICPAHRRIWESSQSGAGRSCALYPRQRDQARGLPYLPNALDQELPEAACGANISDMACSSITNLGIPIDPGATSYSSKTMTRLPDSSR